MGVEIRDDRGMDRIPLVLRWLVAVAGAGGGVLTGWLVGGLGCARGAGREIAINSRLSARAAGALPNELANTRRYALSVVAVVFLGVGVVTMAGSVLAFVIVSRHLNPE